MKKHLESNRFLIKLMNSIHYNVYSEKIAPFNIYEMPNIQTEYIIHYGASEKAYAMLYASDQYNAANVEAIGETGMIRLAEGTEDLTQGGIYTSGADGLWK